MKLTPSRGYVFLELFEEIPVSKPETGFGAKSIDKQKPEQPYKFRVAAVGADMPFQALWVPAGVKVGDIVSHNSNNQVLREQRETAGMLVNGNWYLVVDFRDILGVWDENEIRRGTTFSD